MKLNIVCDTADSFFTRLFGLLKKDHKRVIFFPNCRGIHTFFMKESIDLAWVDENFKIIQIDRTVPPRRIKFCRKAFGIFEFSSGFFPPGLTLGKNLNPSQKISKKTSVPNLEILKDDSGQALVEAAVILPVFILILFGFLQLGMAISEKQKLSYVVNYATQVGSLTNDDEKITGATNEFYESTEVSLAIVNKSSETASEISSSVRRYNDILTVQLRKKFNIQIPFFSLSFLDLEAKSSARILCNKNTAPYVCE